MRTTKRPAWTITPGTRTLINGQEREITRAVTGGHRVYFASGSWFTWLDRLAPVLIVLDHEEAA